MSSFDDNDSVLIICTSALTVATSIPHDFVLLCVHGYKKVPMNITPLFRYLKSSNVLCSNDNCPSTTSIVVAAATSSVH